MKDKILAIIQDVTGVSIENIDEDKLIESGLLKSNTVVGIIVAIEDEFSVEVDVDDIPDNFNRVEDIEKLIRHYLRQKQEEKAQ